MRSPFLLSLLFLALGACGSKEPSPDTEPTPDEGAVADLKVDRARVDLGIPSNSGRICTDSSECAPGDDCLLMSLGGVPTPAQKMCVMPCKGGTACPVPSSAKNSSMCYLNWGTKRYCIWFCEYQGKSYECPFPDSYQCVVPNSTEPGVKICLPK